MSSPGTLDLKEVWARINYAFPVLADVLQSECSSDDYVDIQQSIVSLGLARRIRDLVLLSLERYMRRHIVPAFWKNFTDFSAETDMVGFNRFHTAVSDLHGSLSRFSDMLHRLTSLNDVCADNKCIYGERDVLNGFKLLVRATLLSQLPLDYHIIINQFYAVSFNVFDNETENSDMSEEEVPCVGCHSDFSDCHCSEISKHFHETNSRLMELQLLERLTGQVLTSFIYCRIEAHVLKMCKGTYNVSHVEALDTWLDTTVLSWLTRIYCSDLSTQNVSNDKVANVDRAIAKFKRKLAYYMYDFYTQLRIEELFNIIIDYPDSQPAINDIKLCLTKTDLRGKLCSSLQLALETRLLHPGVNTQDILTAYIHAIRALRQLDPSGAILDTVTEPVKKYLQRREDTVRSVVSGLTEEGTGSELADELAKFPSETLETEGDLESAWSTWNPDPVDADPNLRICAKGQRTNDIISMLVNVYGSKEMFVNEYRTLLADRLLAQTVINTEKEIENLERLKLRFGESQLHFCEVMLKDISDSKRINALMQQNQANDGLTRKFSSNAMILSAQFWPPFKDETLELPDEIKEQLDVYTKSFEALKGNRTLSWKPHLGNVTIDIEIGNKKLTDITVPPIYATIIIHFQTKPEWSLDELHQVMKVPPTILRRKITYWLTNGLIAEKRPDYFVLVDDTDASRAQVTPSSQIQEMVCEDDEAESAMASAHDQREGELQVFWSYIVGMLTNLDSLPLDRIHQMLKMFASQAPGTECSLHELSQFLDTKVRSHQLVLQGGMYKLPKT